MNCIHCGKETSNPKFCSRSCSASYNNKVNPKRKVERKCHSCGVPVPSRNKYCPKCREEKLKVKDMTISEAMYNHQTSATYALIRSRAHTVAKPKGKSCKCCGYDKHVEVCHIKAISDFDKNTMISEVNSPENLILLCPNCHWEFDNGILNIDDITNT